MRWYKAISAFPDATWPKTDFAAIKANLSGLQKIRSEEKTDRELSSIMRGKQGHRAMELMCRMGAGEYLGIDCNLG